MKLLEEDLHSRPAVTYEKRADLLCELLGVRVSKSTICRMLRRLGYTRKKIGGCYGKRRLLRAAWRVTLAGKIDPRKFVSVDEMGPNTSLCARYAFSPKARKAYAQVPVTGGRKPHCLRV